MKALSILAHPHLVRVLRATLTAGGIADQDLGDAVADVQLRVLERVHAGSLSPAPREDDLGGWTTLCNAVAARYAADVQRSAKIHEPFAVPLVGDADDHNDEHTELPLVAFAILHGLASEMSDAAPWKLGLGAGEMRRRFAAQAVDVRFDADARYATRVPARMRPVRCRNGTRGK